jgi:hypothetical protein
MPAMTSREFTASTSRRVFAKEEAVWYLRHAAALARWPVLPEPWARGLEHLRVEMESPERRERPYGRGA